MGYAAAGGQMEPLLRTLGGTPIVYDSKPSVLVADLKLEDYATIAAPLGVDAATRRWLVETGRFSPQCHPDYVNVLSPADLAEKIRGLSKADAVLVPEWVASLEKMSDDEFRKDREQQVAARDRVKARTVGLLLLFPISYQSKQLPFLPQLAEAKYIVAKYQPVRGARGWVVMKRKEQ
jgi:hypothetical protein